MTMTMTSTSTSGSRWHARIFSFSRLDRISPTQASVPVVRGSRISVIIDKTSITDKSILLGDCRRPACLAFPSSSSSLAFPSSSRLAVVVVLSGFDCQEKTTSSSRPDGSREFPRRGHTQLDWTDAAAPWSVRVARSLPSVRRIQRRRLWNLNVNCNWITTTTTARTFRFDALTAIDQSLPGDVMYIPPGMRRLLYWQQSVIGVS